MKHSTITNAADLHFAKAKTFTGDPALVSPDFIDQLLVKSETKEQFIATGTNAGQLVKTSGGGVINSETPYARVKTFTGDPALVTPNFADQLFVDSDTYEYNVYQALSTSTGSLIKLAAGIPFAKVKLLGFSQTVPNSADFNGQLLYDPSTFKLYIGTNGTFSELFSEPSTFKIREFTGSPSQVDPNFSNQIWIATDTNKIYRATGSNLGQLVELSSSPNWYPFVADTGANAIQILEGHPFNSWGSVVKLTNIGGSLPSPLNQSGTYYVVYPYNDGSNKVKLSNQMNGSEIDISSLGSGNHYVSAA